MAAFVGRFSFLSGGVHPQTGALESRWVRILEVNGWEKVSWAFYGFMSAEAAGGESGISLRTDVGNGARTELVIVERQMGSVDML
jgi:hypothetical protein